MVRRDRKSVIVPKPVELVLELEEVPELEDVVPEVEVPEVEVEPVFDELLPVVDVVELEEAFALLFAE